MQTALFVGDELNDCPLSSGQEFPLPTYASGDKRVEEARRQLAGDVRLMPPKCLDCGNQVVVRIGLEQVSTGT